MKYITENTAHWFKDELWKALSNAQITWALSGDAKELSDSKFAYLPAKTECTKRQESWAEAIDVRKPDYFSPATSIICSWFAANWRKADVQFHPPLTSIWVPKLSTLIVHCAILLPWLFMFILRRNSEVLCRGWKVDRERKSQQPKGRISELQGKMYSQSQEPVGGGR